MSPARACEQSVPGSKQLWVVARDTEQSLSLCLVDGEGYL